jgi:hypothetical protein
MKAGESRADRRRRDLTELRKRWGSSCRVRLELKRHGPMQSLPRLPVAVGVVAGTS